MNINKLKLTTSLTECDKHRGYLLDALEYLQAIIDAHDLDVFALFADKKIVLRLDQLAYRFTRMQDETGAKIMPLILELTAEPLDETATFIDKLNRLEKLGVIESALQWLELRKVRNSLAHEYPDDPDIRFAALQELIAATNKLIEIFERIERYLVEKNIV
ncbi:MAG: hypothetical protein WCP79_02370 [Bacillota bacterium]